MISKLFESLYQKVFINVILGYAKTTVYVEYVSKNKVVKDFEKSFNTASFTDTIEEYIMTHVKESPFYYVSFLDHSKFQGALPTCHEREFLRYGDIVDVKSLCQKNQFSVYSSKRDLDQLQNRYADLGIDFIFSPFTILSRFFREKLELQATMYLLVQQDSIALAIFENSELLFAEYMDMHSASRGDDMLIDDEGEEVDLGLDDAGIDLEDVASFEDMNALEDFSDIEDLDSLEEIEEFSEVKDLDFDVAKNSQERENSFVEDDTDGFNEDYQRFLMIQSAMKHFYKSNVYESKFVEHVYVADCVGVSGDFKRYLEEELFLSVYVRNMSLVEEVCDLAKEELA